MFSSSLPGETSAEIEASTIATATHATKSSALARRLRTEAS